MKTFIGRIGPFGWEDQLANNPRGSCSTLEFGRSIGGSIGRARGHQNILWMDETLHHPRNPCRRRPPCNQLTACRTKTFSLWILRWCEVEFVHPQCQSGLLVAVPRFWFYQAYSPASQRLTGVSSFEVPRGRTHCHECQRRGEAKLWKWHPVYFVQNVRASTRLKVCLHWL